MTATVGSIPAAVDQYFENEPGLVAVFDFDYDRIIEYQKSYQWALVKCFPPCWPCCCCPWYIDQNIEWSVRAQHVALTVDGIKYVTEKRKNAFGFSHSDIGKFSKTVAYDKITDCDVQEPGGNACGCCGVRQALPIVCLDTASSAGIPGQPVGHELALVGLRFPDQFKQAVWAMKRGQAPAHASVVFEQPGCMRGMSSACLKRRGPVPAPRQAEMNTPLLVEIRDELRRMNDLLGSKK